MTSACQNNANSELYKTSAVKGLPLEENIMHELGEGALDFCFLSFPKVQKFLS